MDGPTNLKERSWVSAVEKGEHGLARCESFEVSLCHLVSTSSHVIEGREDVRTDMLQGGSCLAKAA